MSRHPLTDRERAALSKSYAIYSVLAEDLKDVLDNGWPDKDLLTSAPLLENWVLSDRTVPNLEGRAIGHPDLVGWTHTSPLHAFSLEAGVARTQTRWYLLGYRLQSSTDERIVPTCELR